MPDYKGIDDYKGQLIHPQLWPDDLNLNNKKVVVIGSGATAVTIIPEIADQCSSLTMLQRSPTYIGAAPSVDKIANGLKKLLPKKTAHRVIRVKNILFTMFFFNMCKLFPNLMKKLIIAGAKKELGDFPIDPHFIPNYKPWDQRFCAAPDGDFFQTIKAGKATVVTDHIDRLSPDGILLKSGKTLSADIIISATGLNLLSFGGTEISIDGNNFDIAKSMVYKGSMISNIPNFFVFIGYTNASWTLKSDLTSEYISRVLSYLDNNNLRTVKPIITDQGLKPELLLNLNSGYINRSQEALPKQGHKAPWKVYQNYIRDYKMLRMDKVNDKQLEFS